MIFYHCFYLFFGDSSGLICFTFFFFLSLYLFRKNRNLQKERQKKNTVLCSIKMVRLPHFMPYANSYAHKRKTQTGFDNFPNLTLFCPPRKLHQSLLQALDESLTTGAKSVRNTKQSDSSSCAKNQGGLSQSFLARLDPNFPLL